MEGEVSRSYIITLDEEEVNSLIDAIQFLREGNYKNTKIVDMDSLRSLMNLLKSLRPQ